ncbi:hypothetical protein [Roseivirga pacifica]|uniref:hypothetical protein n=1 Tax=Roseivirga pacifica TaxID=1267423 RepID=UPI00227C60D2|nr:hypothetical protein [Roseivirga pacifica]
MEDTFKNFKLYLQKIPDLNVEVPDFTTKAFLSDFLKSNNLEVLLELYEIFERISNYIQQIRDHRLCLSRHKNNLNSISGKKDILSLTYTFNDSILISEISHNWSLPFITMASLRESSKKKYIWMFRPSVIREIGFVSHISDGWDTLIITLKDYNKSISGYELLNQLEDSSGTMKPLLKSKVEDFLRNNTIYHPCLYVD